MTSKVLARMFYFAVNGDVSAAKLYLSFICGGQKEQHNTIVENQNNYIQINGTVISQELIKELNYNQIQKIEEIIFSKNQNKPN